MGKSLIIKGADFSAVAVAKELTKPTIYTTVVGFGPSGKASYSEGDVYYRCNNGTNNQSTLDASQVGLYKVVNGEASKIVDSDIILSMDGVFYKTLKVSTVLYNMLIPYYGLIKVGDWVASGYKYVSKNAAPNEVSTVGYKHTMLTLKKNVTYKVYVEVPGNMSISPAIIKKKDGTYLELGSSKSCTYISYTAEDGDVLIASSNTASGNSYWVAEVI